MQRPWGVSFLKLSVRRHGAPYNLPIALQYINIMILIGGLPQNLLYPSH